MHHYKHHIGDYRRDTSHLSLLEHGIYRQLLDWYYLKESCIPKETQTVFRGLSARTQEEQKAVEIILNEFFFDTPEGWKHKRCEVEITAYKEKSDHNREAGKLGGRPKKTQTVISGLGLGSENETQNNPNHKPLTINQEPEENTTSTSVAVAIVKADCPHQEIITLYHEILPGSPHIRDWTPSRAASLRARWNEGTDRQTLDYWRRLFEYIASIPFLTGKVSSGGRRPFVISLDWLVKAENFAKVREGRYEDSAA